MTGTVVLPDNLPSVPNAQLPAAYEAAREALERCTRIDECQDWADKAAAMASYARQSQDRTLFDHATRIQARAVARCGELLREIEPAPGTRTDKPREDDARGSMTRTEAATAAGLTEHERKTALRVSAVPKEEREALIDANKPATVPELAKLGTKTRPAPPPGAVLATVDEVRAGLAAAGPVEEFLAHTRATVDLKLAARGLTRRTDVIGWLREISAWCTRFEIELAAHDQDAGDCACSMFTAGEGQDSQSAPSALLRDAGEGGGATP